jgi:hypothetical protein
MHSWLDVPTRQSIPETCTLLLLYPAAAALQSSSSPAMAAMEVLPSGKVVAAPSERAKGPNDNGPFTKLLDSIPSLFPKVKKDPFGECRVHKFCHRTVWVWRRVMHSRAAVPWTTAHCGDRGSVRGTSDTEGGWIIGQPASWHAGVGPRLLLSDELPQGCQ